MAHVFISYSHVDREFVRHLNDALVASGHQTWVDWEGLPPTSEWLKEIYANIVATDAFLFVLSPDSIDSDICQLELAHAVASKKRIVPVLRRDVEPAKLPPSLAAIQWISFREDESFDAALKTLGSALDTDLAFVKLSARLLVRATDWQDRDRDRGFALHGSELTDAERWLAASAERSVGATPLHVQYITASRRLAGRRRTQLLTSILGVSLVLLTLVSALTVNIYQSSQAIAARNRVLQAEATAGRARDFLAQGALDQATLLSVAALKEDNEFLTRNTLLDTLEYAPYVETVLQGSLTSSSLFLNAVSFDMSGQELLAADSGGHVTLWDAATHRVRLRLDTGFEVQFRAALSPDGRLIATRGPAHGLNLWDASTGQHLARLTAKAFAFGGPLRFARGGSILVSTDCADSACTEAQLSLWDVPSHVLVAARPLGLDQVSALTVNSSGTVVALVTCPTANSVPNCSVATIRLWSIATQQDVASTDISGIGLAVDVAFSPDDKTLAVGGCGASSCTTGQVVLYDAATLRSTRARLIEPASSVNAVAFSLDGASLLTGGFTGIHIWDLAQPTAPPVVWQGHSYPVTSIAINPTGRGVATIGDGRVLLWRFTAFSAASLPPGLASGSTFAVEFSPDGRQFATGTPDGSVILWNSETGARLKVLHGAASTPGPLAFDGTGTLLAAGYLNGQVTVFDVRTGLPRMVPFAASRTAIFSVHLSADGRQLATLDATGTRLWTLDSSPPTSRLVPGQRLVQLAMSADGHRIVVTGASTAPYPSLDVLDVVTGHRTSLRGNSSDAPFTYAVAFSPDGQFVGSVQDDGSLTVWDATSGRLLTTLIVGKPSPSGLVTHLAHIAFSSTAHLLMFAQNTAIQLWDTRSWQVVTQQLSMPSAMQDAALSRDGQSVVAVTDDGSVIVRSLDLTHWVDSACRLANRNLSHTEWEALLPGVPYATLCPGYPTPADPPGATPASSTAAVATPRALRPGWSHILSLGDRWRIDVPLTDAPLQFETLDVGGVPIESMQVQIGTDAALVVYDVPRALRQDDIRGIVAYIAPSLGVSSIPSVSSAERVSAAGNTWTGVTTEATVNGQQYNVRLLYAVRGSETVALAMAAPADAFAGYDAEDFQPILQSFAWLS